MIKHPSGSEPAAQNLLESKKILLFIACVIAVISFVAGTRFDGNFSSIGQFFGVKTSSSQLNTAQLQKIYSLLQQNYNGKVDSATVLDGASHGLVNALGDKYTVYLNAKEAKELSDDLNGTIGGGIGAEIGERNGQPTIVRILPNNPASASGLQMGDVITAINGTSTKDWDANKTANAVRGKEGTTVSISVDRSGTPYTYAMTRAIVNNPSVTSEVKNGVGVITISRFDEQTGSLARKAAETLRAQSVKGVVLDLRGDGGGYIDGAVDVASLWIDGNKTVVTQRHGSTTTDTRRSADDAPLKGLPTVVLVDGGTASASEIVSGALRDYGLATLMGEKSFGKGSVQEVFNLTYGAELKVTIAKWYTPKGNNINGIGFTPDAVVSLTKDDVNAGRDPQLDAAIEKLKT